jgi:hypothetical protein
LHFHPRSEAFVRKEKRHLDGLRETPLAPAITADFVLEKGVECPADTLDDFLRKQQPKLIGIGPVRLHRCFLFPHHHFLFLWIDVFIIHHLLFRAFLMENPAGANLVFGEKRGVQRNLVPIRQSPAAFDTKARVHRLMIKVLNLIFDRDAETIRQTDFYFLSEKVIHWPMRKHVPFINQASEHSPSWEDIGSGHGRKTAAGKSPRRAVRTRQLVSYDDETRLCQLLVELVERTPSDCRRLSRLAWGVCGGRRGLSKHGLGGEKRREKTPAQKPRMEVRARQEMPKRAELLVNINVIYQKQADAKRKMTILLLNQFYVSWGSTGLGI